jgi:type I restriction enzyme S subunit
MSKNKNVPELRFNEFSESWESKKINSLLKIGSGRDYKHLKFGEVPVFGTGGLMAYVNEYLYNGETVCIGRKGTIDKPMFYSGPIWTVDTLFYTHSFNESIPKFVYYLFQRVNWKLHNEASGVPSLSKSTIENISLQLPNLKEQTKIASFLTCVDDKLQTLKKKKALLQQYKKGVMQKIFSQELRFKDEKGNDFPEWEERLFSEILNEHKLKSTGSEEVFSVSVHKGLINQIEHLGRSFAAKNTNNYNLVKPHDIVYTKSPTGNFPLGIIKQSKIKKNVIVSPLYGVFKPETKGLGYLLNVYFESEINTSNYLSPLIQKGAKNTINITNERFLSNSLILPISKKEQELIGNFFELFDSQLQNLKDKIEKTESWKKGLLQKMFV